MSYNVPANLQVVILDQRTADLSWGDDQKEPYVLTPRKEPSERIVSATSPNKVKQYNISPSTNQYVIRDLSPGTKYTFKVCYAWGVGYANACSEEVNATTTGSASDDPLPTPVLRVVAIEPKILHKQNRITIGWSSNNYTHAKVIWGAIGGSKREVVSEPGRNGREVDYTGTFTTDVDLTPNTPYEFSVEVKNNMRSQSSTSEPIMVRSAANFRSLRQFLLASGIPQDQGIRIKTVMGGGISLRTVMGV
jgi:hypothetical protein